MRAGDVFGNRPFPDMKNYEAKNTVGCHEKSIYFNIGAGGPMRMQ